MIVKFDNPNNMDNDPSSLRNREPTEENGDASAEIEELADDFIQGDSVDDEFGNQEFSALNRQLDQLQSALDTLESRNADIHQELLELLQSNREVRRVIVEEMANEEYQSGGSADAAKANHQGSSTSAEANKSDPSSSSVGDTLSNIISRVANTAISDENESAADKNCSPQDVASTLNKNCGDGSN